MEKATADLMALAHWLVSLGIATVADCDVEIERGLLALPRGSERRDARARPSAREERATVRRERAGAPAFAGEPLPTDNGFVAIAKEGRNACALASPSTARPAAAVVGVSTWQHAPP
jgi:hypothetical protein